MSKHTVLDVEGMTCKKCVEHVTKALREVAGVIAAEVQLTPGKAEVTHADEVAAAALVAAIEQEGYHAKAQPEVGS